MASLVAVAALGPPVLALTAVRSHSQTVGLTSAGLSAGGQVFKLPQSTDEIWHGGLSSKTGNDDEKASVSRKLATESVAFHFSLQGLSNSLDEGWSRRLLKLLDSFHYCFDEVLLTIDPQHGGKTYGPSYLPGPYANATEEFLTSLAGQELLNDAQQAFTSAAEKLKVHCTGRKAGSEAGVAGGVHVIDYASPKTHSLLAQAFDLSATLQSSSTDSPWSDSPALLQKLPASAKDFLPARMWKNSLMYMYAVNSASSQLLVHADADIDLLSTGLGGGARPGFVESAARALAKYSEVASVGAPSCYRERDSASPDRAHGAEEEIPQVSLAEAAVQGWDCSNGGCERLGADLIVALQTTQDATIPVVPYISTKLFVTNLARFKSLWPLPHWTDQTEVLLMFALARKHLKHGFLQERSTDLCFD